MSTIDLNILITGASGGIGAATAIRFAQPLTPPYVVKTLILHYNSANDAKINSLTNQISQINPAIKVFWAQADLSSTTAVEKLAQFAQASCAGLPLNVLFANAGTHLDHAGATSGTLDAVDLDTFETTWRVNTLSVYHLTRLLVPGMMADDDDDAAHFGRVIYTSSVAGLTGGIVGPHYASSKSALHGMMHYLAGQYAKRGITFNAVAPALIEETTMLPGATEELKGRIPVGRLGRPEEVAEVVRVMVENGYVSNKVWAVDGGLVPM